MIVKLKSFLFAAAMGTAVLFNAGSTATFAADRTERVKFEKGSTGATIRGKIKGRDGMLYMIGAKAGQFMTVSLDTKSTSTYFNVFAPGDKPGESTALFASDRDGDSFNGELPASGDYTIQVYLYRNAARNNESANFHLNVEISASGNSGAAETGDAKVEGTDFNATGPIPCARYPGQPMGQCQMGVMREGNGNGSITVFWPDGGSRVIYFEMNTPSSYDESQADAGKEMTVDQNADLSIVTIGDERFEIPDVVMAGD
ncbi:MAG: hypothetical protein KDK89_02860 [Alphaproteobacteria bacterium]|nr:hypothetical protein [Alphaproteobacteria bacterium]